MAIHPKRFAFAVFLGMLVIGFIAPVGMMILDKMGHLYVIPWAAKMAIGPIVFLLFYSLFMFAIKRRRARL